VTFVYWLSALSLFLPVAVPIYIGTGKNGKVAKTFLPEGVFRGVGKIGKIGRSVKKRCFI
jgi:hypothetical protein